MKAVHRVRYTGLGKGLGTSIKAYLFNDMFPNTYIKRLIFLCFLPVGKPAYTVAYVSIAFFANDINGAVFQKHLYYGFPE